jgi:hypothetical protein
LSEVDAVLGGGGLALEARHCTFPAHPARKRTLMMTQGAFLRGNDLRIVYSAAQARSARNLEQERFQGGTGRDHQFGHFNLSQRCDLFEPPDQRHAIVFEART